MRAKILTKKLYFRLLCLFLLSTLLLGNATAEQLFTLDAAVFKQRGGLVYLEIYFMIQRDRLKFVQAADGYEAKYKIAVELHSPDTLIASSSWEMIDRTLQLEDITPRQKLPDIVAYNLLPGSYNIKGIVIDQNQNATRESPTACTRNLKLNLNSFPEDSLAISDIELATKLQKGDEGSKFYKNGLLVIPNPERIYGTSLPMLYYYSEIYNLAYPGNDYSVERLILDETKEIVKSLPLKRHKKVGSSAVEVDGFSVASLQSGTYYLKLIAKDHDTGQESVTQTKFFVYRPGDFISPPAAKGKSVMALEELEFKSYTEDELDEAIAELKYLMNDEELRTAERLSAEGKRKFLAQFWKERDPDPTTAINEYRRTFEKRRDFAIQKYSIFGRPGWRTDQGRVYILYGNPDDIEYHTHDLETRSYEVWYYDSIEGGVQFVFVDRNNFGDYRLVHSTKKGELYRPNWYEEEALVRRQ